MPLITSVGFDDQIFRRQHIGGISRYFAELIGSLKEQSDIEILPVHRSNIIHATFYRGHPHKYTNQQKLISSLFDMIPECLPEFFPFSTLRDRIGYGTHANKYEWLRASDHIISISQASADALNFFFPNLGPPITVIHLCSSLHQLEPEPVVEMVGRRFWLIVGKRGGYKNFTTLLMALARIQHNSGMPLLFAAGGGAWTNQEVRFLSAHQLIQHVQQAAVTDSQLAWLYQQAEAVIVPSMAEGFSLPLIEALHADTPVLASDIEAHREVAGDYATLVPPNYAGKWAEVLRIASTTPLSSPSKTLGLEQWLNLKSYYGIERMTKEHTRLYKAITL